MCGVAKTQTAHPSSSSLSFFATSYSLGNQQTHHLHREPASTETVTAVSSGLPFSALTSPWKCTLRPITSWMLMFWRWQVKCTAPIRGLGQKAMLTSCFWSKFLMVTKSIFIDRQIYPSGTESSHVQKLTREEASDSTFTVKSVRG